MVVVNLAPVVTTQVDLPATSVLIVNEQEARSLATQTVGNEELSALAAHFGTTIVVYREAPYDIVVAEQASLAQLPSGDPWQAVSLTPPAPEMPSSAPSPQHWLTANALTTAVRWGKMP